MVCSVGNAKMAVMARLSSSGKFSQSVAERAGHQMLVAQYIQKELLEADDANLLDEEDMHVFDLNPLTDPLHLVCCNFCRKPLKASEFAIHAERCRSLGIAELFPELDSGTGYRKPQRKERKKSVTARKRVMSTGCQGTYSDADASENIASCFQMNERIKFTSSRLVEAKDICHVPAPLATKTYYSQRNNRLQAAISRMYHHASMKECCKNEMEWQGNFIISEAPTLEVFRVRQFDDQVEQCSTVSLVDVEGQASNNFVNQFSMIDAYTSLTAITGATTSRYHPKPCPLAGGSGSSLATIQQPTGSVPVV